MASAWVKSVDCNVCVVDWREVSGEFRTDSVGSFFKSIFGFLRYKYVATINTHVMSYAVERFISHLVNHGMNISDVSIAGHR